MLSVNARVQKVIGVEALRVVCEIGEGKVQGQNENEEGQMKDGMRRSRGKEYLEKTKKSNEAMLRDLEESTVNFSRP
jgi:hypothetical protein